MKRNYASGSQKRKEEEDKKKQDSVSDKLHWIK